MNARDTQFEFTCLGKRVYDIVASIIHSVIFNRTLGKFKYNQDNAYLVGTLGYQEVVCDYIDFTYIQVSSLELIKVINAEIKDFCRTLQSIAMSNNSIDPTYRRRSLASSPPILADEIGYLTNASTAAIGTITLEFFLKSPRLFQQPEPLVWEMWSLKMNQLKEGTDEEMFNNSLFDEQLFDKMLSIVQVINSHKSYVPNMPTKRDVENVFDCRYSDAQPYNFKISYKIFDTVSGRMATSPSDRSSTQTQIKNYIKQKLAI